MAEVERGRLDGHAPVVSTDEIGAVAEGFNRMLHGLRERERVKETFGKYVTPEIASEILAGRISGDGELKEVTVLFADIRDFTPWCKSSRPATSSATSTEYFAEWPRPGIRAHHGLVLQFIGDEIEAIFGAPTGAASTPRWRCAPRSNARPAACLNIRRKPAGRRELLRGVDIHTGTVLAGNIGGGERLSYALVATPSTSPRASRGLPAKDFKVDILAAQEPRPRGGGRGAARGARQGARRGSERLQGGVRRDTPPRSASAGYRRPSCEAPPGWSASAGSSGSATRSSTCPS